MLQLSSYRSEPIRVVSDAYPGQTPYRHGRPAYYLLSSRVYLCLSIYLSCQPHLVLLVPGRRLEPPAGCPRRRGADDDDPVLFSHDLTESQRSTRAWQVAAQRRRALAPWVRGRDDLGAHGGVGAVESPGIAARTRTKRSHHRRTICTGRIGSSSQQASARPRRRRGPFLFRFVAAQATRAHEPRGPRRAVESEEGVRVSGGDGLDGGADRTRLVPCR